MPAHHISLKHFNHVISAALALAALTFSLTVGAQAQSESVIYNFSTSGTPYQPWSGLVADGAGNFYGVAPNGGSLGNGAVYRLAPVSGGWQESTIYSFTGKADGARPYATPVMDASGSLYGTAEWGGNLSSSNC